MKPQKEEWSSKAIIDLDPTGIQAADKGSVGSKFVKSRTGL
jgi:hypothetical protein